MSRRALVVLICALPATDARHLRQLIATCTYDVQSCPGGASVGRDPNNGCQFKPCPPFLPSIRLQCYSQRKQRYVDEGTSFRNCRLPSGTVARKCTCEGGEWVDATTVTPFFPTPASQCYRQSTKSFVGTGISVPCTRPRGQTCTCGVDAKDEPWQAQLFVEQAREFACYAVVRNSQLQLFTACLSSASQLRYVHLGGQAPKDVARNPARTALVDKQTAACREWLETFCAAARATGEDLNGQLCLDFMCTVAGGQVKAYPLECNPRVHSMCCVFTSADQRRYGQVLVGNAASGVESVTTPSSNVDLVVQPSPSARAEEQFIGWWANEFYSWRNNPLVNLLEVVYAILYFFLTMGGTAGPSPAFRYVDKTADPNAAWYTKNFCFRDADFDPNDPLPFLGRNLLQPLVLMWGVLCRGNEWKKYDYCIGKVVEKNGD